MKHRALLVILAVLLGGCAGLTGPGGIFYPQAQQHRLSTAISLMEEGKSGPARDELARICAEKGVPGVTDEALFRLSLLRLEDANTWVGVPQARQDLNRLIKEYPASRWTPLATLLGRYLIATGEGLQREAKLKEQNVSLIRENKDLHQRLEKLKNLELDLGKGTGR